MNKYFLLALCVSLFSCTTDDDDVNNLSTSQDNLYALQVGNQWTYKYLERESPQGENFEDNGGKTIHTIVDTVAINGKTFFKMEIERVSDCTFCPYEGFVYLRQEGDRLINSEGDVLFFKGTTFVNIFVRQEEWGDLFLNHLGQDVISFDDQTYQTQVNRLFAIRQDGSEYPGFNTIHYTDGLGLVFMTISTVNSELHQAERYLVDFQNISNN